MSIKNISIKVTKILRHKLNTIKHNDEGFVLVKDLLQLIKNNKLTKKELDYVYKNYKNL